MALLELTQVIKRYDKQILFPIDLKINENEIVGIVGESGCGKSTLGRLLAHIESPSSGNILFDGHLFQEKKDRQALQIIFQNPIESFSPRMKIKQFLYEPYHYFFHLSKKEALPKVQVILKQVGLDETCLEKYPHELSGGQLQRIAIARALIIQPKLLICDEITSSIDQVVQKDIECLLKDFVQVTQASLVFISHDLSLIQSLCKRVLVMKDGQIIENCDVKALSLSQNEEVKKLMQASYLQKEELALNG